MRFAEILVGALLWVATGWVNAAIHSPATSLDEESNWLEQAARLVAEAQSARADAVQFNKDVRNSRTQLRKIIQQGRNEELPQAHRELHSIMLVMDVLLKSAAACQTAGHIVCPALLMSQLKTVLKNSYTKLDEVLYQVSANSNHVIFGGSP